MQRQKEFARIHWQQQKYHPQQPQQQQYYGWGRNTQQQKPQFGENLSHHYQGWLWQSGAKNAEQVNVKTFCDTRPIPNPKNINYYSNLYYEEDDEEDKTTIHSTCKDDTTDRIDPLTDDSSIEIIESPKQETLFNTSKIKIETNQSIADAGEKGHFIIPGYPLKNINPSIRPLVMHLPHGKALQYIHTGNLDLPWPP